MNMCSVLNFRQANTAARCLVDSTIEYSAVASHGKNLFCALLRSGLAVDVSVSKFYGVLTTYACSLCGEPGPLVALFPWVRCCWDCHDRPEMNIQTLASARKQFGLTTKQAKGLRSFKSFSTIFYTARYHIVFTSDVLAIYKRLYPEAPIPPQAQNNISQRARQMAFCALPYYDRAIGLVEYPSKCFRCVKSFNSIMRDPFNGRYDPDIEEKLRLVCLRTYTPDELWEHFKWCLEAQEQWEAIRRFITFCRELDARAGMRGP